MKTLAFVGYGRFGRALQEIFAEYGYRAAAYDPVADVPESMARPSVQAAVAGADIVFVAVPVASMENVFEQIRPHIGPRQIVVDVGSVKLAPARAMHRVFGAERPWVATHPLFGPVSLARAESGLRVVICPNEHHRDAVQEIAHLYRAIDCSVIEMGAEAHDRVMAQTHAMAFFIAKGMLDAEVPTDSPASPPSFQAMARTIESVRADAGHLITTLHRENPYSAEYRRRLLNVLGTLDRKLNEQPERTSDDAGEDVLSISTPVNIPELSETRERIDEVDHEILQLLHRRAELVRRAQRAKAAAGRGVVDPGREETLLNARAEWAEQAGLDPEGIRSIFESIIALSCEIQLRNS